MAESAGDFLALLREGSPAAAHDALRDRLLADVAADPDADPEAAARVVDQHAGALQLREQMESQRRREAELAALYETASDLTAIRDLDEILAAIVRRARQLLRADMTYLSLNDHDEGASYMKVTDGALTAEFRTLRLPLGTGLLGLVAQTGEPYFTEDYQSDERFVHRDDVDSAVGGEQIHAILGVPLSVDGVVIGALLAVHRTVRRFPATEVALLTSFAAHAAVALQNARLFEQEARAVEAATLANRELRERSEATERAAHAHDLLTDALLHGGGVAEVHAVLGEVLGGDLAVLDTGGLVLAGADPAPDLLAALPPAVERASASGRSEPVTGHDDAWVALAAAGEEHLSTLVLTGRADLPLTERRTLERGAIVVALVQLFARIEAEATDRVRGELLTDVLLGRESDETRLRERAARQGVRLEGPLLVAVACPPHDLPLRKAGRLAADLAREQHGLGGEHDGAVTVVVPDAGDPLAVGARLRARLGTDEGGGATVGVACAASSADLGRAHAEAARVVRALVALDRRGEVSDPTGLGVARLLLTGADPDLVDDFLSTTLGPLRDYDERRGTALLATVTAWFDAGGSAAGAARALHVHTNTVTQRLERVAELIGSDWREPRRAVDLQLALRLERLRDV